MVDKNILALDTATQTGVAILKGRNVGSRTVDLREYKKDGNGAVYIEIMEEVSFLIRTQAIDIVYKEAPFFSMQRGRSAAMLYGIQAAVEMACHAKHVPFVDVHNSTLKKYITGDGRAKKKDMIAKIKSLGYPIKNDHEADAMGILLYACGKEGIYLEEEYHGSV